MERYVEFSNLGALMHKVSLVISVLLIFLSQSSAIADPPPGPVEIQDRIIVEGCKLSSEKPHISEHVPGTVNVAMPCVWTRNQTAIKYNVVTIHKMSNGKSITTKNKAAIKC